MSSFILTTLLSYILLYKYLTLFLFIFVGSFLLPLPDNALLLAVGAFASQGYLNVYVCFLVAYSSNVLADILGYYLTYRYGVNILSVLRIKPNNHKFEKVENWLKRYAGITVFITRISGPFGPAVNFLSGLIRMPFKKFIFADLSGNLIDIAGLIFCGYFVGNYWQSFLNNIQYFGWLIFFLFLFYIAYKIYPTIFPSYWRK